MMTPPEAMQRPAAVIFCERSGKWAAAMRAQLAGIGVAVRQTRSLADCDEALRDAPASLLILELTLANVDDVLQRLATLERDDRQARAVVVADRDLATLEWIVMEAGALALVTSFRQARLLVAIVARFFAERPVDERPAAERIWSRLPWRETVTSSQRHLAVTSTAQVQPE